MVIVHRLNSYGSVSRGLGASFFVCEALGEAGVSVRISSTGSVSGLVDFVSEVSGKVFVLSSGFTRSSRPIGCSSRQA